MHALRDMVMIPALLASGMVLYGVIQLVIALVAVALAWKWKKFEFIPGLLFLFLYTVIEAIDLYFFTVGSSILIDVAQFGFILIAILFFIGGMHPTWSRNFNPENRVQSADDPAAGTNLFSLLRRL